MASNKITGGKPGPGRPKGSPNKITATLKEAILKAFDSAGGPKYLESVASNHPAVFCQLLGKVLPMQPPEGAKTGGLIWIFPAGAQSTTSDPSSSDSTTD